MSVWNTLKAVKLSLNFLPKMVKIVLIFETLIPLETKVRILSQNSKRAEMGCVLKGCKF